MCSSDLSELINDLRLEGTQQLVQSSEVFTGDASETEFTLTSIPEDIAVYYSAAKNYATTTKLPSEVLAGDILGSAGSPDYEIDKKNKKIVFVGFTPAASANNILTEYSYYTQLPIHQTNDISISNYGTYAKTITLNDILNLEDAWNKSTSILNKYSEPFKSAKLKVLWTSGLDLVIGQSIRVVDSINTPSVDAFFTIYKITDYWPENIVEIEVGDKQYTIEEYQANVLERIKRLEETVIGGTAETTIEVVQTSIGDNWKPVTTGIVVYDINDSFILGHPNNAILGTTGLGSRMTISSTATVTYNW